MAASSATTMEDLLAAMTSDPGETQVALGATKAKLDTIAEAQAAQSEGLRCLSERDTTLEPPTEEVVASSRCGSLPWIIGHRHHSQVHHRRRPAPLARPRQKHTSLTRRRLRCPRTRRSHWRRSGRRLHSFRRGPEFARHVRGRRGRYFSLRYVIKRVGCDDSLAHEAVGAIMGATKEVLLRQLKPPFRRSSVGTPVMPSGGSHGTFRRPPGRCARTRRDAEMSDARMTARKRLGHMMCEMWSALGRPHVGQREGPIPHQASDQVSVKATIKGGRCGPCARNERPPRRSTKRRTGDREHRSLWQGGPPPDCGPRRLLRARGLPKPAGAQR